MKAALSLKCLPGKQKQSSFPLLLAALPFLHVAIKVQLPQAKPVLEGRLLCQNNVLGTGASRQGQERSRKQKKRWTNFNCKVFVSFVAARAGRPFLLET
ncbi:hypothetical protein CDAR_448371 [Caerostris darwini]|uniref:Secreted protein n=1 Tax=Caerostris darwini TaxID=1538125 RepID=A0AAV4PIE9_9ARAC|nr:hypothetical protein CDAR_448371 [Caerostris darwini]